jgi:spore cortex formation protein SpoVR/YcgB (stage V sporulation)
MTKEELKKMFSSSDWNDETILRADEIISRIAKEHLGLDVYPNQFEIVTSEQMLDAYSLIGLPISYGHWKFGKDFVINQNNYKKGRMGLAYELVINSNPCISYNMEDNTTCLMLLVLAHAAYGHNHFFKNNYLFKLWTHADSIIDYMLFARNYISKCEEKYGYEEVEYILDCCHALMNYGVDKYKKPKKLSPREEEERFKKRVEDDRVLLDDIWRTLPSKDEEKRRKKEKFPKQPEENILYFLEKNSPTLKQWQREIVRIVRKVSQYFYPQGQSKVINEGCATFSHYEIINKMYEEGYLDEGFMQEFYHHHSNVIFQPEFDSKYYSGLNPYTLGFNIFSDIKRMSLEPTEEDKKWFPDIAGKGDWPEVFRYIVENFKDETFVLQYLSPKVIRDMRLFSVEDNEEDDHYKIEAIHDDEGYRTVRKSLADNYNRSRYIPDVQVYDVDIHGDRTLTLSYTSTNGKDINLHNIDEVLEAVSVLWGFDVRLIQNDDDNNLIWDYSA